MYNRYQTLTSTYESIYGLGNNDDDFTCRTIIEDFTFNGFPNPRAFNDRFANMDYYFDRYRISEKCRVRFARMRLMGSVRTYWTSVERDCTRRKIFIKSWEELKSRLEINTFPSIIGNIS